MSSSTTNSCAGLQARVALWTDRSLAKLVKEIALPTLQDMIPDDFLEVVLSQVLLDSPFMCMIKNYIP